MKGNTETKGQLEKAELVETATVKSVVPKKHNCIGGGKQKIAEMDINVVMEQIEKESEGKGRVTKALIKMRGLASFVENRKDICKQQQEGKKNAGKPSKKG